MTCSSTMDLLCCPPRCPLTIKHLGPAGTENRQTNKQTNPIVEDDIGQHPGTSHCDRNLTSCPPPDPVPQPGRNSSLSPNSGILTFLRGHPILSLSRDRDSGLVATKSPRTLVLSCALFPHCQRFQGSATNALETREAAELHS